MNIKREVERMQVDKYLEILEKIDKKLKELGYVEELRAQIIAEIVKNLTIN